MAVLKTIANRCVRAYLRHAPVTDGKRRLLAVTKPLIQPGDVQQCVPTKHGFSMRLNLANPEQERIYYYGEHDERYETAILKALIAPGMHCWDVGANIGFYTCLLARLVGPTGRVVAFEPAGGTRDRLQENIALNGLSNAKVVPCAVGAAQGEAQIHYSDAGLFEGTASLLELPGRRRSEPVSVETIDRLVQRLGQPDFLKIDVEGAQLDVWRGGEGFFRSRSPLVLAELRESDDAESLRRIEARVRELGYEIYAIRKGQTVRLVAQLSTRGPRNYLLAKAGSAFSAGLNARSA